MLLAVDPGASSGWALFAGGRLALCGLGDPPADTDSPWMFGLSTFDPLKVVIEFTPLRPYGEKNPNSIVLLARNAGEWGGRYSDSEVRYATPNEWKGGTPKKIDHARTKAKLSSEESQILKSCFEAAKGRNGMAPKLRENVLDAIGIGLWAVGR